MEINLITVGSLKSKNMDEIAKNFIEKISKFIKFKKIIIDESKIINENNNSEIKVALKNEAIKIKKYMTLDSYNFILAIEGVQYSSIEFNKKIFSKINSSQYKKINFIIGSSHGLDDEIKKSANELISFSQMTFPHQLFQIMLLEQIYRCFTIEKNIKYHK